MKLAATLLLAALSLAGCVDDVNTTGYGVGIGPAKPFNSNPRPIGTASGSIFAETLDPSSVPGLCDDCVEVIARHEPRPDGLEQIDLEKQDGTPLCSVVVDDSGIVEDGCNGRLRL